MVFFLKVLGGIAALALGLWLGRPEPYRQSHEEIEKILDQPSRRHGRVKRHLTPLDWFKSNKRSPDRLRRHRFKLSSPDRDDA